MNSPCSVTSTLTACSEAPRTGTGVQLVRIDDWTSLEGSEVEVRHEGKTIFCGMVDAVTSDGTIMWVCPDAGTRRLFEKAEFFQAWAADDFQAAQRRAVRGRLLEKSVALTE